MSKAKILPKQPGFISIKANLDCPMTAIVIKTIPTIKKVLFGVKSVIFRLRYLSTFIVAIIISNFCPCYMQKHKNFATQHSPQPNKALAIAVSVLELIVCYDLGRYIFILKLI